MSNGSSFSPTNYYRFFNGNNTYMTLSSGQNRYSLGNVNMTTIAWSSSENWQLYPQSGRIFIRNYDFGSGFQLGISDDSLSTPRLMIKSGGLGQQWIFSQLSDSSWQITNELLGGNVYLQLPAGGTGPIMSTNNQTGTHWVVEDNETVNVTDTTMLTNVANLESPTSTRTLTPTATSQAHIVSQTSNSSTTASSCPSTSNNSSLSRSSIAVLGFASTVILMAIVLLMLFSLRRRRRKRTLQQVVPFAVYHHTDAPMSQQASNTWTAQYPSKKPTAKPSTAKLSELDGRIGVAEIDGRTR